MNLSKIIYVIGTISVFLLLFLYFLHPIHNLVGDLAYYLKMGEVIIANKTIPATNLFSYTYPNFPFINPNWLSEVIFYAVHSVFGWSGLTILAILIALTSFALIFFTAWKKSDPFTTILISLIYVQVLYERTEVKSELFSFLLLAVFISLLYKYKDKFTKWIFILIPLEILWVNLHIYFFLGIVVLLVFLLDKAISEKWKFKSKEIKTLLLATVVSILATLVNPQLLKGALYPLFVMNNYAFPVEENTNFIKAFQGYSDTTFLFFGISVVILWTGIIMSYKKIKPVDLLLSIFFTFIGLFAVRAFPLFVLGTFIACTTGISKVLNSILKKTDHEKTNWIKTVLVIAVLILIFPTVKLNLQINGVGLGLVDDSKEAINFIQNNNIKGPIYNNYDIGNYLDYELYPNYKVFVDNRPEAYPKDFFNHTYFPMQLDSRVFSSISKKYNFNVIIISLVDNSPATKVFLGNLAKNKDWEMVYLNSSAVIFLKDTLSNQEVIKKHLINEKNLSLKNENLNNKEKVRLLVNFFGSLGWEKAWLNMNLRYLDFDPKNCAGLQNVAYIMQREKNPNSSTYSNEFMQNCQE